jgi:hypothetical protein
MLCYDLSDPQTYAFAGRWLRQLRAAQAQRYRIEDQWYQIEDISFVLVGTKSDLLGAALPKDAVDFVSGQAIAGRVETSAKTGDRVAEPFIKLVADVLDKSHRHAELQHKPRPPEGPLGLFGPDPECDVIQVGDKGLEILLAAPKPLSVCMQHGFWHRVVHIWVLDPDRRALLVQRKVVSHRKYPDRWTPSATGEVMRNHSTDVARALALQQIGLEATDPDTDRDPRVDAVRGPELELISTVLHTAPVPKWVTAVVGENALIQEVVDLYLVEVRVVSRDDKSTEGLRVKLDATESTEARLVPYEELLRKLASDPLYIHPGEAYIKALRRGLQKRWTDPLWSQEIAPSS